MLDASYLVIEGTPGQDVTQQMRDLEAQAVSEGKALWIGFKDAVISSTVNLRTNLHGPGAGLAGFLTKVEDGSPTLYCEHGHKVNFAGFSVKGHVRGQKTTGFKLGEVGAVPPESYDTSRSTMRDVKITRCEVGLEWQGWINKISDVLITWCDIGAKLMHQNASEIDIKYEENGQDFTLSYSAGLYIPILLVEGSAATHAKASTVDNVHGLTIGTLYTEMGNPRTSTEPWIDFGTAEKCRNISIGSAMLGCYLVESLLIDHVDGFRMDATSYCGEPVYRLTPNAVNIDVNVFY